MSGNPDTTQYPPAQYSLICTNTHKKQFQNDVVALLIGMNNNVLDLFTKFSKISNLKTMYCTQGEYMFPTIYAFYGRSKGCLVYFVHANTLVQLVCV